MKVIVPLFKSSCTFKMRFFCIKANLNLKKLKIFNLKTKMNMDHSFNDEFSDQNK